MFSCVGGRGHGDSLGDTITPQPLAAMTWEEARAAAGPGSVAILPVGAIEAHGPHLPLETDVIIAEAMARSGAAKLAAPRAEGGGPSGAAVHDGVVRGRLRWNRLRSVRRR